MIQIMTKQSDSRKTDASPTQPSDTPSGLHGCPGDGLAGNRNQSNCGLLIIGYGNTLRGDDGVGPAVATALAALNLPGVESIACQQLSPEHAAALAFADKVVFVDAAMDPLPEVQLRRLEPDNMPQLLTHAAHPRMLLTLARDVFGHSPQAWMLTIPGSHFNFREHFSILAQRGVAEAVGTICALHRGAA